MGNFQTKILPSWFCFCSPGRTESALELSSNPRNNGSGESIQSDKFDEATQVIVHDIRTNRNYVKARHDVENDPDPLRYIPCPLQERSNEVVVEIPMPGISLPYPVCKLDFAELGLDTKRQQGLIPHIYVTRSQLPAATQSGAAANMLGGSATVAAQTSTRSSSSPSWRHRRGQKTSSSSTSRPKPITPGITVQPQTSASVPQSRPQPEQSSQRVSRHSIPHLQHQLGAPPSSSRTAGVPKPTASQNRPTSASTPPLSISPMPNG